MVGTPPLSGAGMHFIPVIHEGHTTDSQEEAEKIADLVNKLLKADPSWRNDSESSNPITLSDVLIVTPYNLQVRAISHALPDARVGTVDKFQGQQGPISIYSMATSSEEDAPRGMEFLYSLHRLNVATSRARCISVVVASPNLLRARCRTPRQMRLANGLARSVEMARKDGLG